jgi:hypothetical protein
MLESNSNLLPLHEILIIHICYVLTRIHFERNVIGKVRQEDENTVTLANRRSGTNDIGPGFRIIEIDIPFGG